MNPEWVNPKCLTCGAEIANGNMFAGTFADGKWSLFCDKDANGLPLKVMNPARMWVVNGGAEAHRAEQKAIEDAEAVS